MTPPAAPAAPAATDATPSAPAATATAITPSTTAATDTLTNTAGESFTIADDGTVTFARKSGEKVNVDAKFESIPANGRPAAQLLIASSIVGLGVWKKAKP